MKLKNIEIIVNTDYSLLKSTIGWKAKYDGLLYGDFISLNEPTPSVAKVIEATNVLLKQAISVCEQLENESTPTADVVEEATVNAVKEFAERLKEKSYTNNYCQEIVLVDEIGNLVKEFTEGKTDE